MTLATSPTRRTIRDSRPAVQSTQPLVGVAIPALLLFTSGIAALIYQILWIKQLSLVVGVEVYAITTGISAFFAGLALGGFLFGRWADRLSRPVRLYSFLELAVAVLGIGATLGLAHAAGPFARLELSSGLLAWVLPFALVGIPAFLMGGTLPVLIRALTPLAGQLGAAGGRLYAANTAGAIIGALLTSFLLIPALGIQGSAYVAAALNMLAALAAFAVDRRAEPRPVAEATPPRSAQARLAITLYALAGGIALGYEVIWSQSIVQFMSTRAFAFSVVLATYLTGLVLGSALYARRADRIRDPWGVFALLIAGAGLVALLEITLLGRWLIIAQTQAEALVLGLTGNDLAGMCARFAVAALSVVFIPTVLLGAAFPVMLRLAVDAGRVGRDVGSVVALNTLGGIVGTLLTGFLLVPWLGLVHSLAALALAAAAIALCAVLRGQQVSQEARQGAIALGLVTVLAAVFTPSDRLAQLLPAARNGQLSFYEEGRGATVAVVDTQRGNTHFKRLYIQGVSNSGDAMPSLRYMRLQALLPLLIQREEPRSALVIGFGTGITAGALLRYPGLDQRVVAELLPAVVRAAPQFQGNFAAGSDPRLEVRLRDGRRELLRNPQRYDLITLEPPPPSAAGVVNLYSRDFYQLTAQRLNAGGQVAQWLPLPTQNDADTRALVRSFLDVFPHASLWTTELHEMLLIGSFEPLELDVTRIRQRFEQAEVSAALRPVGIISPAALLATWVTDRAGLERYAGDAQAVTDDQPGIEYAPWVRPNEFARVLPKLLALRSPPPLVNADDSFRAALADQQARLMRFYAVGLFAYTKQRAAWSSAVRQVLAEDGGNPYYRWFIGGTP
ncbi:fused MFS/spermidine synthase [Pseudomonas sp. UL073]|uniref:Fused MFS/spermidine synthase n=1 Tax=Zestomonas insulae TaxID=2809017 RepID=A0ABS2IIQ3_9GAMM|nr:fused MFS/spermidine synthase [Pseudomonas insulae]MBM7061820.1 fused MFS/spermidine synthase [Pseudomonas insulae]